MLKILTEPNHKQQFTVSLQGATHPSNQTRD